jgi:hypothetical protein
MLAASTFRKPCCEKVFGFPPGEGLDCCAISLMVEMDQIKIVKSAGGWVVALGCQSRQSVHNHSSHSNQTEMMYTWCPKYKSLPSMTRMNPWEEMTINDEREKFCVVVAKHGQSMEGLVCVM